MGISCINRCGMIMVVVLIVHFVSTEDKADTNELDSTLRPELLKITDFDFENDNFFVVINDMVPDFTIYFTKEDVKTGKGSIYRYDEDDQKFVAVTFQISANTTVKSLDKLIVTGDKMWAVSKIHEFAFYINKDYKHENAEALEANTEYLVHPNQPDIIIKYTINESGIKTGYLKAENGYKDEGFSFVKLDFIPFKSRYIYLSTENTFKDVNAENGDVEFTESKLVDYRQVHNHVLLIKSDEVQRYLELSVYDSDIIEETKLIFPELLKITEVKLFQQCSYNYHLILVHHDKNTCLWTSTATEFNLGRTICSNMASESLMESNFYLDTRKDCQIFLNFVHKANLPQTLRSQNNGRAWYEMKFLNPNESRYTDPVHFKFSLHDHLDVEEKYEEIDIQYIEVADGRQPFISYDNGNLWRATPKTNSRLVMLCDGMVLVSVGTDTNIINYNIDEGKTWIPEELFKNNPRVLYIGRFTNTEQKALIVTKDEITNKLIFSSIDFSKFFKTECTESQYRPWILPAQDGYCHFGIIFDMRTRIPNNYCIDKKIKHTIGQSDCSCLPDFYGCTFGYQPCGDICVPDNFMHPKPKPKICTGKNNQKAHESGFIKMEDNHCYPDSEYYYINTKSTEFCVYSDYTDFLVLYTDDRMYMYRISVHENKIVKKRPVILDLFIEGGVRRPVTFDFVGQMTYSVKDKYIIGQPFFGISQKSIYYLNDDVTTMMFEPISKNLIFITSQNELKVLSFITNFEYLIHVDVVWFKYCHHQRLIRFMTTTNQLCHCRLLESHDCTQGDSSYLNAFVDSKNSKGYFLTDQNELQIQTLVNDFKDTNIVSSISKVLDFAVYDNHLFYVSEGKLIYNNVASEGSVVELDDRSHFSTLDLYRVSLQSHQQLCENLNCQFMCFVDAEYNAKCICPPSLVPAGNVCNCPNNNPDCLDQFCAGFLCKNKRCLLKNIKCNNVNECGDESDETGCSQKCLVKQHLCNEKCISKDIVCMISTRSVVIYTKKEKPLLIETNNTIKTKTTIIVIGCLAIWVVLFLPVLIYIAINHGKSIINHMRSIKNHPIRLEIIEQALYYRDSEELDGFDLEQRIPETKSIIEKKTEIDLAHDK